MKALNLENKKIGSTKTLAGLLGILLLALTGCGSSNNNGTTAVPASAYCAPGYANCGTTGAYGYGSSALTASNGLLARAAGFDGARQMELALQFIGQAGTYSGTPYTGPYSSQGYFVLTSTLAASCPMPAGTYQIQSISQGYSWNAGTNLNLQLIAVGPGGQIQMTLTNGFVSGRQGGAVTGPDGQPYENYVAGTLTIAQCPYLPITIGI